MDVFTKYAYGVILAQKNIYGAKTVDDVTEEMLDKEIEKSLEYFTYYSKDDPNIIEKSKFSITSHQQILDDKNLKKGNVKLLQHICINPKQKSLFYYKTKKELLKMGCCGLNFPLFSSTTYLSRNSLNGFNINAFEKKLYFLAHVTPYKPSYFKNGSTTIYLDLSIDLLTLYIKIFIEEWESFNLNKTIDTNRFDKKNYHYPKTVNFPTKEKYYKSNSDLFYVKLYALSYFNRIKELAEIYDYDELYKKLGKGSIVEVNSDSSIKVFKLNEELVKLTKNDSLSELLKALKISFEETYKDKGVENHKSAFTYSIIKMLKDLKDGDNIRIINEFKIKFYKYSKFFDNDKFLKTMDKLFGYNLPKEIVDEIKTVVKIIKGGIYGVAKDKTKKNPTKIYDIIDAITDDIAYSIKGMNRLEVMLHLPENIRRRANRKINITKIFNYLSVNPDSFNDVKNVIGFYLYQKLENKKEEIEN